jgi:hypothetical protein
MPASSSEGRRAAQASAAPMDNDQAERDANLKKVQARDLVEFGMIPVITFYMKHLFYLLHLINLSYFLGICWAFSSSCSFPFIGC